MDAEGVLRACRLGIFLRREDFRHQRGACRTTGRRPLPDRGGWETSLLLNVKEHGLPFIWLSVMQFEFGDRAKEIKSGPNVGRMRDRERRVA